MNSLTLAIFCRLLMRVLAFPVIALVLMLNVAPAGEMDTDAVAKVFSEVCAKCHGPTGRGMASFPRLSDKKKDYIAHRLRQYRAEEKVGPNSPLMIPHAVNLTDAEIDGLAAYISTTFSGN